MKTIGEYWKSFESAIIPTDAPDIQKREMRKAFYAGAASVADIQYRIGCDDVSEEEGMKTLEKLHRDIDEYYVKFIVT